MKVALIVAMDSERGIGKNNDLMWHLPADMKFFKDTTKGHIVVMGRKNYDSIPERYRPLVDRENAILTRNTDLKIDNCKVFNSLEACLEKYKNETKRTVFIIGGGEIFKLAFEIDCVDEMYVTKIDKLYSADTHFPAIDESKWTVSEIAQQQRDEKNEASFKIYHYVKNTSGKSVQNKDESPGEIWI